MTTSDPASFVNGVPVKIAERYRPPRNVFLSSLCNCHVNVDVLSEEDLIVERSVLQWLEEKKQRRANILRERNEAIEAYDLERAKKREEERVLKEKEEAERLRKIEEENELKKLEEEKLAKQLEIDEKKRDEEILNSEEKGELDKESEEDIPVSSPLNSNSAQNEKVEEFSPPDSDSNSTNTPAKQQNMFSTSNYTEERKLESTNAGNEVEFSHSNYPAMLTPTQVPFQKSEHMSNKPDCTKIDFTDFEADPTDPFDSTALKSINEMEELAQILQGTNIESQKPAANVDPNLHSTNYSHPGSYVNNAYPYSGYASPYNVPVTYPPTTYPYQQITDYQAISNKGNIQTPNTMYNQNNYSAPYYSQWNNQSTVYPQDDSKVPKVGYSYASNSVPIVTSQNPAGPTNLLQAGAQISNSSSPITAPSLAIGFSSGVPSHNSHQSNINNILSHQGNISNLHPSNVLPMVNAHGQTTTMSGMLPSNPSPGITSVSKRPDLEDFYSKYYACNRSAGAKSGESTPTSNLQTSDALRSCNSVPDLTASEDSEVASIVLSQPMSPSQIIGSVSRPSSTGQIKYMASNSQHGSNNNSNASSPYLTSGRTRLADPFAELTSDAQDLVQNMAEMGFPRPRVARAIQKLGSDHKKLLEVLLNLQKCQDRGDDPYRAEVAFYYYMGEMEKVVEFLQASKQLMDLGFEEDRVIELLFKHANDTNKALEEFIV